MLLVQLIPSVIALGISTPFISDNELNLDGKTYNFDVTFQNPGDKELTMVLEVIDGKDWTSPDKLEVIVPPGEGKVGMAVETMKIKAPLFKSHDEVKYVVSDLSGTMTQSFNVRDDSMIHNTIKPYALAGLLGICSCLATYGAYHKRKKE